MTMEGLTLLVNSEGFLSAVDPEAIDDMLDSRDTQEFEDAWNELYEKVKAAELPDDESVRSLCEVSFKRTLALTRHPELSGYISDDFELIANAMRAEVAAPVLKVLLIAYSKGEFPHQA